MGQAVGWAVFWIAVGVSFTLLLEWYVRHQPWL